MQRTIQQITQQLIDKLPDNDQYYRLDELRSWGFPSFVVNRIKIELERNLAESMIIPKTDWANTQSDAVQDAWQKFVDAIRAEARLPASYAKAVIETAVADILEILVQPRKNIPRLLFEDDEQLSYEELQRQVKLIVVYQHFAQLIPRYMQKKELDQLSQERCAKVVSNADQKLTERYSPLNWAQMLEPVFKLVDGEIDTNLLRLFFEDKKMPRVARKFDMINDSLTRAELIEVLSSPELLDFEGYEDEQSTLFEDQPETVDQETPDLQKPVKPTKDHDEQETEETKNGSQEISQKVTEPEGNDQEDESEEAELTLNSDFTEEEDDKKQESDDSEDDSFGSLNDVFGDSDAQEEETETVDDQELSGPDQDQSQQIEEEQQKDQSVQSREQGVEEQDEARTDTGDAKEEDLDQEKAETEDFSQSQGNGQESETGDGDDEETPIWMRYMSEEEIEEYQKEQEQADEDQEEEVEDGFVDEPVIDLTNEDATDQEIKNLRDLLESDRELFVEEIFRGSDRAYDQAVEEIAAYDSWRDVSKYIEKDIFKRNLVDMYSEAAVDFTDRLQTYFLEKQNQSK